MISKEKQYRTRDGREVRIYATDGGYTMSVHGAVNTNGVWMQNSWNSEGKTSLMDLSLDLIEIKPRIRREMWLNIYPEPQGITTALSSKRLADDCQAPNRIACVKVVIDCEEGEGL